MNRDSVALVALSAIWGASFVFMRVLAPALGPFVTACLRVSIAGAALTLYFQWTKLELHWREEWRHYFIIGAVSSAVPFVLYTFASLHLPASVSVILNASAPLSSAVLAVLIFQDALTLKKLTGLLLGLMGVVLVALKGAINFGESGYLAVLACLAAALCYGIAASYIKARGRHLNPYAIAGASQVAAGLVLAPAALLAVTVSDQPLVWNTKILLNLMGLALLCSAVAYLLYYRLIANLGPVKALTVTFLMPIFGLLWGALFLDETITVQMVVGCGLILSGTRLVLRT
jgi:drug/metabolite transporter (DMT)-like permease